MHSARAALVSLAFALLLATAPATAAADDAKRPNRQPPPSTVPALPEGDAGIAARYPLDHGIARDPAVLWQDDFEAGHPLGRWDMVFHEPYIRVAEGPDNVHGGARALEFTVPQQEKELSNAIIKRLTPDKRRGGGAGHDVVFFRYYSKFDPGFDQIGSSHNGALLAALSPGIDYATPGVRADGRNKFIASFECWRGDPATPPPGGLNVYLYHPEQRTEYGDHLFPSGTVLPYTYKPGDYGPSFVPRPDLTPERGRWYCHELMMRANTPGQRDGRIACWIDGKLVADFPNLRLRDDADLKINHAELTLHIKTNPTRANSKWYDDVVVATQYIGPVTKDK
jgi:hypothetical protein